MLAHSWSWTCAGENSRRFASPHVAEHTSCSVAANTARQQACGSASTCISASDWIASQSACAFHNGALQSNHRVLLSSFLAGPEGTASRRRGTSTAFPSKTLKTKQDDLFPEEKAKASLTLLEQSLGPDKKMPSSLREAGAAVAKAGRQLQYWVHRRQALAKELPIYEKEVKTCYEKAMRGEAMKDDDDDTEVAPPKEPPKRNPADDPANGPISLLSVRVTRDREFASDEAAASYASSFQAEGKAEGTDGKDDSSDKVVGGDPEEDAVDVVECKDFLPSPGLIVGRRAASEAYWQFDRALNNATLAVGRAMDDALARGA